MPELPFAEDVNYWQTGHSSPDVWLVRATAQIESVGGVVVQEAFGKDADGHSAYLLTFIINEERYKLMWPVLPTKSGKELAARIQAATLLYHDVKARCMTARVLGPRAAFFTYYLLPDGRPAGFVATPELVAQLPKMLTGGN